MMSDAATPLDDRTAGMFLAPAGSEECESRNEQNE